MFQFPQVNPAPTSEAAEKEKQRIAARTWGGDGPQGCGATSDQEGYGPAPVHSR